MLVILPLEGGVKSYLVKHVNDCDKHHNGEECSRIQPTPMVIAVLISIHHQFVDCIGRGMASEFVHKETQQEKKWLPKQARNKKNYKIRENHRACLFVDGRRQVRRLCCLPRPNKYVHSLFDFVLHGEIYRLKKLFALCRLSAETVTHCPRSVLNPNSKQALPSWAAVFGPSLSSQACKLCKSFFSF